jgi:hypothetical protein
VGQRIHCACLQRGGSGSPAVVVEITSIPYANARPHDVDLVHCCAADQEAMATAGAGADHRCGSDHSRDVAVELAELRHCFDRSCPIGTPAARTPQFGGSGDLVAPALGVALIAFVDSIAAAKSDRSTTASTPGCRSRAMRCVEDQHAVPVAEPRHSKLQPHLSKPLQNLMAGAQLAFPHD